MIAEQPYGENFMILSSTILADHTNGRTIGTVFASVVVIRHL